MNFYENLRSQVRYYFENIDSDRFLQNQLELSSDGFLKLDVLLTFRRLSSLNVTKKQLISALKFDKDYFELRPDDAAVRPRNPIVISPKNFRDKTIYVEKFPNTWSRNQLKRLFSQTVGRVMYIDMPMLSGRDPKFPRNKGYAFVEFEDASMVSEATELYRRNVSVDASGDQVDRWCVTEEFENLKPDELLYLGKALYLLVISKNEWLKLKEMYIEELNLSRTLRHISNQRERAAAEGLDEDPDYTKGTILKFSGSCESTNKGVWISLIGQFGKVAYVEFLKNETPNEDAMDTETQKPYQDGYVRFKNRKTAHEAFEFFQNNNYVQLSCGDAKGENMDPEKHSSLQPIRLQYLTSQEEKLKWDEITRYRLARKHALEKRQTNPLHETKAALSKNHGPHYSQSCDAIEATCNKKHHIESDVDDDEFQPTKRQKTEN